MPAESARACAAQLRALSVRWEMITFGGGVLHGFTNPAQALNDKPQFEYDQSAACTSWRAAKQFLADALDAEEIGKPPRSS